MSAGSSLTAEARELLKRLRDIAQAGPIPAAGFGATSVGMTLLSQLGVKYKSSSKPMYNGIVVSAQRSKARATSGRVNLFARVPDWSTSRCKSVREIAQKYGYIGAAGKQRLFCTVTAKRPNSQGLFLRVSGGGRTLEERFRGTLGDESVAIWRIDDLRERLLESHPQSMWVTANATQVAGVESFHYTTARYSGPPLTDNLVWLIEEGTVTIDHLIELDGTMAREKGPLFKIAPENVSMLFPDPLVFDLLEPFG